LPQIPGYVVVLKLGQGGCGTVYFAKRIADGKGVALKTLTPINKAVTQRDVSLFQREMTVCMSLKHPNIVSFEEQGCFGGGSFYFSMEYCSGGSLHDLVTKRGFLSVTEAMPIFMQVLDALICTRKRLRPRDLKPRKHAFR
jgi:serine/threonine protein kinase